MKEKIKSLSITALFAIICFLATAHSGARGYTGAEEILSFHSDITVQEDSSMTVEETIRVRSAGREIKRGIYRDFPTRYRDRWGNRYVVGFKVKKILRDGRPEAYHTENLSNGKRLYIGRKNHFLRPGEYVYTIVYKTDRQIGFFPEHDELYWNVTGNDWAFPIEAASARVRLPTGIPKEKLTLSGYTGYQGSKESALSAFLDDSGNAVFRALRGLNPREGLTIALSWPKDFVAEPGRNEEIRYFFTDNPGATAGLIGLVVLVIYYTVCWFLVGKDPARGTIIPLFSPPPSFSPAAMRYISKMGYDHKVFAAAIINMAVKGFLKIREEDGVFIIEKGRADKKVLAPEEKKIAARLLGESSEIELKQANHAKIGGAVKSLKRALRKRLEKIYFNTNRRYLVPGILITVATLVLIGLSSRSGGNSMQGLFICLWLGIWSIGVLGFSATIITRWKAVAAKKGGVSSEFGKALLLTLFYLPFFAGEGFGIYMLANSTSAAATAILIAIVVADYLFYHLLKAPTRTGRNILDKIEGFKMFLSVAEKERLRILHPPEKTPELYERYLPYALALGVEQAWAQQFSEVLAHAGEGGREYHPAWYSGQAWSRASSGAFASSLGGAVSSAVASSSTAPGSSSGGGGGGFSGGGGGGGGGGGW